MESNFHERISTRCKNYDYASSGAYFITICTQDRVSRLSEIVGEGYSLPQLTPDGEIAERWIKRIGEKYPSVYVACYVIMPNHIHLLLHLKKSSGRDDPSPTISAVVGWLKYQITSEINLSNGNPIEKVFQRSFHDHIIRSRDAYQMIYKYIHENPIRWKFDKLYTE